MFYADPGSGAMVWQLLLAFFFGASFFFKRLKTQITTWWAVRKNAQQLDSTEAGRLAQPLTAPTEGE